MKIVIKHFSFAYSNKLIMSEQDILNFCEITGGTPSDARNFLEVMVMIAMYIDTRTDLTILL